MGFNLRVLLHVGGILVTVLVLTWCVLNTRYYATMLVVGLLLVAQVVGLLRLVHATNRELVRFLHALHYMDFSQSFRSPTRSGSFRKLNETFNSVMDRFRAARSDKEQQAAWLQTLVQHLPVAIMVLDEDGKILLGNTALQRLLGRNSPPASLDVIKGASATLAEAIKGLQPGQEPMHKLLSQGTTLQLKLSCTLLRRMGRVQKLVCIQNIAGELEGRELEAWQNLIRVMTHEIMNSITPLSSLAETAEQCVVDARQLVTAGAGQEQRDKLDSLLEDTESALQIIGKRGQALLRFVSSYRTLSRLPLPVPEVMQLQTTFDEVQELLAEALRQGGVKLLINCHPSNLQLLADAEQIEQALINVLRNAMEAVAEVAEPAITLAARLEEGGTVAITVSDNGSGISRENLDNIFIPFFTTKRGGSGIGMSVVKQIVRANGGRISVISEAGQGTGVRLLFRQY